MTATHELRMVITVDDFDEAFRFYRDTLGLEVDDVDGTASTLTAAGTRPMNAPFDAPWGDRIARLETPHGMQLTLFSTSPV